jgi:uncharacterized protein
LVNTPPGTRILAYSVVSALALAVLALGAPRIGAAASSLAGRPAEQPAEKRALVEMEVKDVVPLEEGATHAVILVSGSGTMLPVFVDEPAAVAIAFRLAHREAPHALSEDLLDSVIGKMGGKVVQVRIGAIQNHLNLSTVTIRQGEKMVKVAARASDSIAMALSSGAKIFATAELVEEVGITKEEIDELKSQMGVGGSGDLFHSPEPAPADPRFSL